MPDALNILFAGTPEFALPAFKVLLQSEHRVVAAYTQPDRPAGRGRKLTPSPVKELALASGIPVMQPASLRDPAALEQLRGFSADLMVVVAYGLLLPKGVLEVPRLGCVNIHASLLPRWRGAAPIQRAILAGDRETGVGIMRMEEGLDTGPVYLSRSTPISAEDTAGSLHDRLAGIGADALIEALPGIADGTLVPQQQDETAACYAAKLDKREADIDWSETATAIARRVRAFNPWPVAQTRWENGKLRIWDAHAIEGLTATPGTVMAAGRSGIDVATGQGLLRITRLQAPGKRAMSAADFVNANSIQGIILG
jgi:methionyl-tRNA formyltransferase